MSGEAGRSRKLALTHFDDAGAAHMVDVGAKPETARVAIASGVDHDGAGDRRRGARRPDRQGRRARRRAARRDPGGQAHGRLIPLCHPLRLTGVDVDLAVAGDAVAITATVRAFDRSGVEMEALAAVSAAALTVYDMCKAIDRGMVISDIRLEEKRGGKSGTWTR